MATKRLTPYTVHVPEDMLEKLKKLAKQRQASSMVRDAIGSMLDGTDAFGAGYNKAIKDCVAIIKKDELLNRVGVAKAIEKEMRKLKG